MSKKEYYSFVFRFGGSTGSLSSPSPTSEEHALPTKSALRSAHSGSAVYSPDVALMESPREGGFGGSPPNNLPQSTAVLKKHIKELYAQISKAEADKQKIADQAYRLVKF